MLHGIIWLCLAATPALADDAAMVSARAREVTTELELIRWEMGRPHDSRPPLIRVENATHHDVYHQSIALYRRCIRFSEEQTHQRSKTAPVEVAGYVLGPSDVLAILDLALERIREVKTVLEIPASSPEEAEAAGNEAAQTPTQVYERILIASHQLDQLLEEPASSSDAFQELTRTISYVARLLARFPNAARITETPALERGKQPVEVLIRLARCIRLAEEISAQSGLPMTKCELIVPGSPEEVTPRDNFDLAVLIGEQMDDLERQMRHSNAPQRKIGSPGRKTPSDVDQRAGILESQMTLLLQLIKEQPGRITASPNE